jgi:hypothetical protein
MALSAVWCLLTAGWFCIELQDQNTWSTIPASEHKIHWIIKQKHWIEQKHWRNKGQTIKTRNKQYRQWMVECSQKGWNVTIQYLLGLNIFVIKELKIATLICLCVSSWGISSRAAEFYFLPAGSLLALWRMIEFPSTPCGLMPNLQSITSQIPYCNDSVTRIAREIRVPTKHSRDILHQAKGIILVESSQIRWWSRWLGRGGWSGWVVARDQESQNKSWRDCLTTTPMRQHLRQPDRGPVGWIKGLLSRHVYLKKESLKTALSMTEKRQMAAHKTKSTTDKKERIAYSNSGWRNRWK